MSDHCSFSSRHFLAAATIGGRSAGTTASSIAIQSGIGTSKCSSGGSALRRCVFRRPDPSNLPVAALSSRRVGKDSAAVSGSTALARVVRRGAGAGVALADPRGFFRLTGGPPGAGVLARDGAESVIAEPDRCLRIGGAASPPAFRLTGRFGSGRSTTCGSGASGGGDEAGVDTDVLSPSSSTGTFWSGKCDRRRAGGFLTGSGVSSGLMRGVRRGMGAAEVDATGATGCRFGRVRRPDVEPSPSDECSEPASDSASVPGVTEPSRQALQSPRPGRPLDRQ